MKRIMSVWATLLFAATLAILAVVAAPAGAAIGGQADDNLHPYVGTFEIQWDPGGEWEGAYSCTLVAEDVVLTAASAMEGILDAGLPVERVRVLFDPVNDPEAPRYAVARIEVHSGWTTRYPWNSSKRMSLGPGAEDVALVWLTESVPDLTPVKIVAAGGLDGLDLTKSPFTHVGYGITSLDISSMRYGHPDYTWIGRNYLENVSVVSEAEAYADRYLKITVSTTFGDEGGPLLYNGVEVAINSQHDKNCVTPCYSYRLDAPLAQEFLRKHLDAGSFVVLP